MKNIRPLHWLAFALTSMYLAFAIFFWLVKEYNLSKVTLILTIVGGLSTFAWPIISPKYSKPLGVEPYQGRYSLLLAFTISFFQIFIGLFIFYIIDIDWSKNNLLWHFLFSILFASWVTFNNKRQIQ